MGWNRFSGFVPRTSHYDSKIQIRAGGEYAPQNKRRLWKLKYKYKHTQQKGGNRLPPFIIAKINVLYVSSAKE